MRATATAVVRMDPPIVPPSSGIARDASSTARGTLPKVSRVLAVCAHPDDESFGFGAILASFAQQGATVRVLCLTHGEASTLGATARPLAEVRADELRAAADVLGVSGVTLLAHADGHLEDVALETLARSIEDSLAGAEVLLVFDIGGITGHADHCRATDAALVAARRRRLPVLAWTLPERVAAQLNSEFGTAFVGREDAELSIIVDVDRARQLAAIACHATQSVDNPVLWRRLELLGTGESLRWLA